MCGPGPLLRPMLAVLRRSWDLCWQSWAALGPYVGGLGAVLGPMLAVLGCLGAYVGGLGPLLGPMLAVLGRSWGYVGGPGPLLGLLFAILAALGALCWRSLAALGRKVAQTRAGRPKSVRNPSGSRVRKGRGPPEACRSLPKHLVPVPIFSIDIWQNPETLLTEMYLFKI